MPHPARQGSKRIGITLGDQAGIGPEITHAALAQLAGEQGVSFELVGEKVPAIPGQPDLGTARAAVDALESAATRLADGSLDAVVTAPVSKEWLHRVGFGFPGQTEFFAARLGAPNHAMCLSGNHLTVGLVTVHEPLAKVAGLLRAEEIVRIGRLLHDFCLTRGRPAPRIAVCGLNPHAGENGAFGDEEGRIISPAIAELQGGCAPNTFSGPYAADTVFRSAAAGEFDAVLCMYHDQGLIPLKLLDFDSGVNVTLGLPRPRTSPDHGTAYGIAGKGVASHASMLAAIRLACQLA
jgi:4-hydroxythreonine-4-phosphate dehydrogenase